MSKKIAVVTGSSSGFGLLTTLELAKNGIQVIATMRNIEKGKGLLEKAHLIGCGSLITVRELDVTSVASVECFKEYLEELGRIDVLINNAGYAGAGFVEEIPIAEYRSQFDTNLFGVIMVTQACLPFMRQQKSGKVINISSISGLIGFPGLSPYVASKHALEGFSESLRLEMKPFGIDVCLVEPGSFKTNIWSSGKQITEKSLLPDSPYFQMMKRLESHLTKGESTYGDPKEVAQIIVEIAQSRNPKLRYPVGKGVKISLFIKKSIPWKSWEKLFLKRLT
jgi:NAD(P)-dependent dehydrogenase (short-subunit alcohol dehydrogenase family)